MFFILYKTILNFIMPPGIFIIGLILTLILYIKTKKRKVITVLLILNISFLYLFSIEPVKDVFVKSLENNYKPISAEEFKEADSIIMLGGGINSSSPLSLSKFRGVPSNTALARLTEVVRLYNKKDDLLIFLTGGIVYGDNISEAQVYKNYMMDLGVKKEDIIIEKKSKTTYENLVNIKERLAEYDRDKTVLVTSATHMKRGMYTAKKLGIDVIANPTDYHYSGKYDISSLYPSASNMLQIKKVLWEYIGIIYYKLKRI
ncbi:MAG: YdcF family protein [Fusobacteriota bacterium]